MDTLKIGNRRRSPSRDFSSEIEEFGSSPLNAIFPLISFLNPFIKLSVAFMNLVYPIYGLVNGQVHNLSFKWLNHSVFFDIFIDFISLAMLGSTETKTRKFSKIEKFAFFCYALLPIIYLYIYLSEKKFKIGNNLKMKFAGIIALTFAAIWIKVIGCSYLSADLNLMLPEILKIISSVSVLFIAKDIRFETLKLK